VIEPIRGQLGAFDVSCSGCGEVCRFESLRYSELLIRLRATGWRLSPGGDYCRECQSPVLSASPDELQELFGIEFVPPPAA
jgi:hypothetical protein